MPSVVIIPQAWNFFNVRMFVVKYIQVYLKLCGKFTLKKLFKFKTNNCKKNITGVCIQNLIDWCMYHNINNTFEQFLFRNFKNNLRAIKIPLFSITSITLCITSMKSDTFITSLFYTIFKYSIIISFLSLTFGHKRLFEINFPVKDLSGKYLIEVIFLTTILTALTHL